MEHIIQTIPQTSDMHLEKRRLQSRPVVKVADLTRCTDQQLVEESFWTVLYGVLIRDAGPV